MTRMRVEARFLGRVQGVGFRAAAHNIANALGVGGWVMNDPDGSVCLVAEGDEKAIRAFLEQLRHRMAENITEQRVSTTDDHRGYTGFEIRY